MKETKLTKIAIESYRSCFDTSFECHPNLSVLIGPNGSGKTNVLQAIMLLNQMARQESWSLRNSPSGVSSGLRLEFNVKELRASLIASVQTLTNEANKDTVTQSLQKWKLEGSGRTFQSNIPLALSRASFFEHQGHIFVRRPSRLSPAGNITRGRNYIFQDPVSRELPKWTHSVFVDILHFSENIKYYSASQFTNPSACPVSFEIEKEGEEQKLYRLTGHARLLYDIYTTKRTDPADKFHQFFQVIGPDGLKLIDSLDFKEVETSSVNYTVKVGGKVERRHRKQSIIIPQFKIGRQVLSPNQLSEGTFKTLALLFHVITDESSALLIEEPEVCIHHGLLSSVLEIIKRFSSKKQMFISTHSDYVLDHIEPENVFRVNYEAKSGTAVRHISKTMSTKEFSALRHYLDTAGNLGEYWREGGLEDTK